MSRYDLIIIGGGSAGLTAAEMARDAGAKKFAVIETGKLGGECPNRSCIPTKTLLHSVAALRAVERAAAMGVRRACRGYDLPAIIARRDRVIRQLTGQGRLEKVLKETGAELIKGQAEFTGKNAVTVDGHVLEADKIVVATGSEYILPNIDGLADSGYVTSDELLLFKKLPKALLVLGGGPVGVEIGQVFAALGTKVTIVEYADRLLPREDREISEVITAELKKSGIKVLIGHQAMSVVKGRDGVTMRVRQADGGKLITLKSSVLLLASGKRPALQALHLEKAGVKVSERGWPEINEYLQSTTNPAIYFAGDAAGRMMYTAVAHREGAVAVGNALKGNSTRLDLSVMPRGVFGSPEIGSVGLTEDEARRAGYDVAIGRANYSELSKGLVDNELNGLIKLVCDRKTGSILGGHIVGRNAAEIIHEVAVAMYAQIGYQDLANMIHAFPTYAEGVWAAANAVQ